MLRSTSPILTSSPLVARIQPHAYDFRKPHHYLHRLQHGRPLLDWDHTKSQEEGDSGVMMTVWGIKGARLYTGSSDGIVESWDIMRAPEDVHVGDFDDLGAGVTSGAFSPDFSHLLAGDLDGGVHILSSALVKGWADLRRPADMHHRTRGREIFRRL